MRRRAFLTVLGGGAAALAGCTSRPGDSGPGADTDPPTDTDARTPTNGGDGTPTPLTEDGTGATETDSAGTDGTPTRPPSCPTTQGFDVEWPTDLDAESAASFVEAYERVYYREVVVEYEPESSLDSCELSGGVTEREPRDEGWVLTYSGSGGVYRPTLALGATTADPPGEVDPVPVAEVEDDTLVDLLETAAEAGEAEHHVEPPGPTVDRYVDRLTALSPEFDGLSGPGDSDSLHADVDGKTVKLTATATNFHGDYWWTARYYVDERVVRRVEGEDADPREGTVVECRGSE
ncbi:MAG: hypothetical protein V5A44_03690 [Haloarculaceae archaeon]